MKMKVLLVFLFVMPFLPLVGQDTTFIMVVSGVNSEDATSIRQIDSNRAILCANSGSFGKGGSDLYFARLNVNAEIELSWTWGGVNQDVSTKSELLDSTIITCGYRNSFDDPDYHYFVVAHTIFGEFLWLKELANVSDKSELLMNVSLNQITLIHNEDNQIEVSVYNILGGLIESFQFSLQEDMDIQASEWIGDLLIVTGKTENNNLLEDVVVFTYDLTNQSIEYFYATDFYDIHNITMAVTDSFLTISASTKLNDTSTYDISMWRLDTAMNLLWTSEYAKSKDDYVFESMMKGNEFNFVGLINSFGESGDFGFGRFDSLGNYIDLRTLGSSKLDECKSFTPNSNNGFWFLGNTLGFGYELQNLLIYYTNNIGVTYTNDYVFISDSLPVLLGLERGNVNEMSVYPNPVPFNMHEITVDGREPFQWSLYNIQGQELKSGITKEFHGLRIPLGGISKGTYFLELTLLNNGQKSIETLILE